MKSEKLTNVDNDKFAYSYATGSPTWKFEPSELRIIMYESIAYTVCVNYLCVLLIKSVKVRGFRVMVFNATSNNISEIRWWSVFNGGRNQI